VHFVGLFFVFTKINASAKNRNPVL